MSFTAKSVILDIADNWGSSTYIGIRQIDFWYDGSKIANLSADYTAYATSTPNAAFDMEYAFDTSTSKTGSSFYSGWVTPSGVETNERLICVFDSPITFDEIRINNNHASGNLTDRGAKNVVINISTDTITNTTYGASIANSTKIFDSQFDQHVSSDEEDEQILTLSPPTANSVTYDGNGNTSGTVPTDSNEYFEDDTVTVLGNTGSLAKTDHVFTGWNTAADGTGTSYDADDTFSMGAENVTLYAVWDVVFVPLNMSFSLGISAIAIDIIGNVSTPIPSLDMGLDVGASPHEFSPMSAFEIGLSLAGSPLVPVSLQPLEIGLSMDLGSVSSFETGSAIIRYFCILTGSADSTTDLTLPMKSFQARRRSGDPTYLSVVIPTVDYAAQIAARSNGTLKIQQAYEQNGVIKQTETIMETTLDEVNVDEGGSNQSVTLMGYSTSTYTAKAVTLSGVTYRSTRAGKYHYRLARPYIFLNPGDTVTFSDDGVSFIIDTMTYFINPTTSTIELAST